MDKQHIVDELNKKGIYKFEKPFVDEHELRRILNVVERHLLTAKEGEYEFGKACRIGAMDDNIGNSIYDLFSDETIWQIAQEFFGDRPAFNEIFLTHDYTTAHGLARNGWLHFDRIPTLKFFMYLTDCTPTDGPFKYLPGSHTLGQKLRTHQDANDYDGIKNRLEVDYPELGYSIEDTVPMTGPAGTMFIFHSDLFHCGGAVEEGSSRKIIRMHLRP